MSDEREENGTCAFCRDDLVESPILLDVRRHEHELPACQACYDYLQGCEQMHARRGRRWCDVCLADVEDSGVRFLLCDQCWDDVTMERRVLFEDGEARTPPSEPLRGGVRA